LPIQAGQTVVLYGDEGIDVQATAAAIPPAANRVLRLRGGVRAWLDDIMNPRLPEQATPAQRERYERQRVLAEYFGGQALRYEDPSTTSSTTDRIIKQLKRRTC
jgi:hypothetical protein